MRRKKIDLPEWYRILVSDLERIEERRRARKARASKTGKKSS